MALVNKLDEVQLTLRSPPHDDREASALRVDLQVILEGCGFTGSWTARFIHRRRKSVETPALRPHATGGILLRVATRRDGPAYLEVELLPPPAQNMAAAKTILEAYCRAQQPIKKSVDPAPVLEALDVPTPVLPKHSSLDLMLAAPADMSSLLDLDAMTLNDLPRLISLERVLLERKEQVTTAQTRQMETANSLSLARQRVTQLESQLRDAVAELDLLTEDLPPVAEWPSILTKISGYRESLRAFTQGS